METPEYKIEAGQIEQLQMISDRRGLDKILNAGKSTIIQGGVVLLIRTTKSNPPEIFDRISTEADFQIYQQNVLKHLD